MATAPTAPIYTNGNYAAPDKTPIPTTGGNNTLGKEAFLKLLTAQLKYQDPLEPVKDTDFIAQLASFSNLEEMSNMSKTMDKATGVSLMGKQVTDDKGVTGIVQDVGVDTSGNINVKVAYQTTGTDGKSSITSKDVSIDKITVVQNSANMDMSSGVGLIGKKVTTSKGITGVVQDLTTDATGSTYLTIAYQITGKDGTVSQATAKITMDQITAITN